MDNYFVALKNLLFTKKQAWLRNAELKGETESLITAAQD